MKKSMVILCAMVLVFGVVGISNADLTDAHGELEMQIQVLKETVKTLIEEYTSLQQQLLELKQTFGNLQLTFENYKQIYRTGKGKGHN